MTLFTDVSDKTVFRTIILSHGIPHFLRDPVGIPREGLIHRCSRWSNILRHVSNHPSGSPSHQVRLMGILGIVTVLS